MTHLAPRLARGPQPDLLAAAHRRRLVRAGFHPATPAAPAQSRPTTGPETRSQ